MARLRKGESENKEERVANVLKGSEWAGVTESEAAAQIEIARLKRENERLSKDLAQARALIDLQKKLADLLGTTLTSPTQPNENSA